MEGIDQCQPSLPITDSNGHFYEVGETVLECVLSVIMSLVSQNQSPLCEFKAKCTQIS